MNVAVERKITQVVDGSCYKGHVKIAETQIDYELKFTVPIPRFAEIEPPKYVNDVRRFIQLTVTRGEKNIDLTDDEFGFFLQLLVEFAFDFYYGAQTRDSNDGFLGQTLRGEGPFVQLGASASISNISEAPYDFPPELCRMLNDPKFGCQLTC